MAGSEMFRQYWWLVIILIVGVIIVTFLGWAWVYLYRWTNKNLLVGFTAPVNDSIWELSKIFIFPFLLFFVVLYASAHHVLRNPAVALLCATLAGVLFFWTLFYLYTWFNPVRSSFPANVTLWILAVMLAMVVTFFALTAPYLGDSANYASIAIYLILIILWLIFTYVPPVNGGMWWHKECGQGSGGGGGNGGLIPPPCGSAISQATNFDTNAVPPVVQVRKGKDCESFTSESEKPKHGKKHRRAGSDSFSYSSCY